MKNYLLLFALLFTLSCAKKVEPAQNQAQAQIQSVEKPKITFVELGSVSCIPCRQMQGVMKNIEEKYGSQIKVVFYDVNKERAKSEEYKIKLIPTQVFLDSNGAEFHRHEGFYPEEEIAKIFATKGVNPKGK